MVALVDIYNLALSATGAETSISLPTESSREAEICGLWYESVRDQVLRAAFWPSTKRSARLALIGERADAPWVGSDPDPGWRFVYAAPSDMLAPRFISDYSRFELSNRVANARTIVTDVEDAILTYTFRQISIDAWDISLRMAIIYALAAHISMPLTGKLERVKLIQGWANDLILQARVDSANTNENQVDSLPPWIEARGYADVASPSRYVYPMGGLIAVANAASVN